jgi:hypothetical protein
MFPASLPAFLLSLPLTGLSPHLGNSGSSPHANLLTPTSFGKAWLASMEFTAVADVLLAGLMVFQLHLWRKKEKPPPIHRCNT